MTSEELRRQARARMAVSNAVVRGSLERHPCEVCGDECSQAHHADHGAQLSVRWLCVRHHRALHARTRDAVRLAECPPGSGRARLLEWMISNRDGGWNVGRLASAVGVSLVAANQWLAGRSNPKEQYREAIERVTGGIVTAGAWATDDGRKRIARAKRRAA